MQNAAGAIDHLKNHGIAYPATKVQLVAACNGLSDFSDADKAEFAEKLPDATYNSADDVTKALGWPAQ
ncbi:DUF2795 domain-containing protein [Candidatus Gottesmanbacteria bacterium]|nr:DUF2795 domain-containing protein [Candidatus Gottesmanbacteria bacterium]